LAIGVVESKAAPEKAADSRFGHRAMGIPSKIDPMAIAQRVAMRTDHGDRKRGAAGRSGSPCDRHCEVAQSTEEIR
jgi:hypothetical protein